MVGALIGWTIVAVTGRDGVPIRVAWSGPITLLAAAAVLVCLAYVLHLRLQVNRLRIPDRQAVAWLALGKAGAVVGALMAGGYFGFAIRFVPDVQTDAPRERVIRSAVAIIGGIVIMLASLRVERACLVPPDDPKANQDKDRG